jgi:hypothetical protein
MEFLHNAYFREMSEECWCIFPNLIHLLATGTLAHDLPKLS